MGLLREIRELPAAIHRLVGALHAVAKAQTEQAPAIDRLEELERSRSLWEADMEAEYQRAQTKYRAAHASEQRERKVRDAQLDPFTPDSEEVEAPVPGGNAEVVPEEGMLPLHMDLAPVNRKANALRYKYL